MMPDFRDCSESEPIYLPKEGSFSLNLGAPLRPEPTLWSIEESDHWVDEMGDVDELEVETREQSFPITNDQHITPLDYLVQQVGSFLSGTNLTSIPPQVVQQAFNYRLSVMTPRVLPATNSVNPYLQFWLPLSMNDRALFSALLSASLSHQVINGLLSGGMSSRYMEDTPHLQACYKETILALNDALRDPARATSDGTILAVLMTVEKPEIEMQKLWSQESPFQAPLQGLQWLNVHSAREPNLTHQNGLCRIIELRGGLSHIKTPGVAAAVFYRVLVNSTLLLTAPALPFYPLSGSIQNILDTETSDNQILMETTMIPIACDHPNISLDMKCTFSELAAYTRSIESYVRGDTLRLDAQMMCDRRNLAQYNLMSIPSTSGQHHEDALSEICRIAAIIYSICVTFPLSGVGAPFSKLVLLLQSELKNSDILESEPQYSTTNQVLLWVLTMGGIASIDKHERKWYVSALAEVMSRCQLSEWTAMKSSLKDILWLESACNMPGKELWKEACSVLQQQSEQTSGYSGRGSPCTHCKIRKIKCGKKRPCENCVHNGLECGSKIPDSVDQRKVHVYTVRQRPCDLCKTRRVKCDKGHPCQRCLNGGFSCTYK